MINAEVNEKHCQVRAEGDIKTLCVDLTAIIQGMLEGMDCDEARQCFKEIFTMGYDDGVVLGISKKELDSIRLSNSRLKETRDDSIQNAIDSMLNLISTLNGILEDKPNEDEQ